MIRSAFDEVSAWASVLRDDELAADQAELDHVVDGVAAGAADAEHGDAGLEFPDVRNVQIDSHCLASRLWAPGSAVLLFMAKRGRRAAGSDSKSQKLSLIHRPMRDR